MNIASTQPGTALRRARHLLEGGSLPPAGLIAPTVAHSWERSLRAGLLPFSPPAVADHLAARHLAQAVERRRELLMRARPVMDYLHAQTKGSDSVVILADDNGVLIEALGDAAFVERAERVALKPGASWHERHRGTNAIGTALVEAQPVAVHGGEHFFEHNRFLTCAAAPIAGPDGRVLGVLDISGPQRGRHPHTFGLVRAATHMIENKLFEARHEGEYRIRFHPQADGIGTLAEGMVALSEEGLVIGANRAALAFLAITPSDIGKALIEALLPLRMADILDHGHRHPGTTLGLACPGGGRFSLRVEPGWRAVVRPAAMPAPDRVQDALADLDTGDPTMAGAIERVRKILGKPIPLLLQGESGVGKEVFATALHATGPRRGRPFVAVNCAALPEHLIEAELFGYAPGAFTGARREGSAGRIREAEGGTLFLDEIGDMPLALQCRLLRVLQDRQVVPLGGGKAVSVDFALIAASHRPLKAEAEAGRFRADLYYRLNGLTLCLPPLRARRDFAALVARMIETMEPGAGIGLDPDVADALAGHGWPGNLRQLANVLRFACALRDPGEIRLGWHHLPEDLIEELRCPSGVDTDAGAGPATLRAASDSLIERMVAASGGNLSEAARRLGISRNTLYRRMNGWAKPPAPLPMGPARPCMK
ncbi:sigma-54-dependent Fis family transcriptional regulator [Rhodospirillum rubrum]|uniref:Sigma54 Specific Transcriptional Regulator containing GAF, and Fis DNA-binding domains n=1 Tax=Rhodospirillum rubrum (strain ATCC 11170 / ATH 1.1.1 / DSM 467 / LMG 4362 / NCIMB 8255 / S1) TaxID=269796 RepID=Q2RVW2_RHORT|nr:sigma-54-dependent Fis family transcriptional regulator [Rhodospirillum rubrum]ABC21733.1 Sigma54 Specific Transcriptional Regulator containing GAF, and Fis DNA-binding domains [Rhodospirillum rubrum ATCC 11170]QXG81395.1 sigma-54-dependent Fis family transcriptional regulator [Rhodospirillum rubrum]HAQ00540.1 sigma-54-dependent Fis family transcriptional regulator [Rhodospirillum rubrum]HCF17586.1 sigma-54-dependent Fis family transcriptional regulator [Rhodospirillum rubrum]